MIILQYVIWCNKWGINITSVFHESILVNPSTSCYDKCLEEGKGGRECAAECADGDGEGISEIRLKNDGIFVYFI